MNPHGSVATTVHLQMSRAGYELVATHDLVKGHWFGEFRVHRDRPGGAGHPSVRGVRG
jgi:hypothetical protein